jgi:hypothetical protein
MAKKKKKKSAGAGGGPRKCGVCHKRGHNSRSHERGGRLAK